MATDRAERIAPFYIWIISRNKIFTVFLETAIASMWQTWKTAIYDKFWSHGSSISYQSHGFRIRTSTEQQSRTNGYNAIGDRPTEEPHNFTSFIQDFLHCPLIEEQIRSGRATDKPQNLTSFFVVLGMFALDGVSLPQ